MLIAFIEPPTEPVTGSGAVKQQWNCLVGRRIESKQNLKKTGPGLFFLICYCNQKVVNKH